jgi:hypothetical protein
MLSAAALIHFSKALGRYRYALPFRKIKRHLNMRVSLVELAVFVTLLSRGFMRRFYDPIVIQERHNSYQETRVASCHVHSGFTEVSHSIFCPSLMILWVKNNTGSLD